MEAPGPSPGVFFYRTICPLGRVGGMDAGHDHVAQHLAVLLRKGEGEAAEGSDLLPHLCGIHVGVVAHFIEVRAGKPSDHLIAVEIAAININNRLRYHRPEKERHGGQFVGCPGQSCRQCSSVGLAGHLHILDLGDSRG